MSLPAKAIILWKRTKAQLPVPFLPWNEFLCADAPVYLALESALGHNTGGYKEHAHKSSGTHTHTDESHDHPQQISGTSGESTWATPGSGITAGISSHTHSSSSSTGSSSPSPTQDAVHTQSGPTTNRVPATCWLPAWSQREERVIPQYGHVLADGVIVNANFPLVASTNMFMELAKNIDPPGFTVGHSHSDSTNSHIHVASFNHRHELSSSSHGVADAGTLEVVTDGAGDTPLHKSGEHDHSVSGGSYTDWASPPVSTSSDVSHSQNNSVLVDSVTVAVHQSAAAASSLVAGLCALWDTRNGAVPAGWTAVLFTGKHFAKHHNTPGTVLLRDNSTHVAFNLSHTHGIESHSHSVSAYTSSDGPGMSNTGGGSDYLIKGDTHSVYVDSGGWGLLQTQDVGMVLTLADGITESAVADIPLWESFVLIKKTNSDPPLGSVLSPPAGAMLTALATYTVTWSTAPFSATVHIDISSDNGTTWSRLVTATANDGSCLVTWPNVETTQARIRVVRTDDASCWDWSQAFTIRPGGTFSMMIITDDEEED